MTNTINFDTLIDRRDTDSNKWDRYKDTVILPMWVADSDFSVAPEIIEALNRRIDHGVFGYSHPPKKLIELVVERMARYYAWNIRPEWLVWQPGVVNGLNLACRSVGSSGEGVFIPSVIYPPFTDAPELSARTSRPVPMIQADLRWVLDLQWLAQNISANDRLLLLCNPQNPGGSVYNRAELSRLAELVVSRDLIICSDEVHSDLILDADKKHIPIASLDREIEKRSITVNILGYIAAQTAYESGGEWNRQQVVYLRGNRDYLLREINLIRGLGLDPIEATYLAWIDVSELGLKNPAKFFEQAGVGMSAGREFGDKRFMRMNFGCPRSLVRWSKKLLPVYDWR